MGISILHIIMQSSTPSIRKESLSPKTLELGMHPQEINWNEPHVHKQRWYFNKANQIAWTRVAMADQE